MAKKIITKTKPWRQSPQDFKYKIGQEVQFNDGTGTKGLITEHERNPELKPYVIQEAKGGRELYADEADIKAVK